MYAAAGELEQRPAFDVNPQALARLSSELDLKNFLKYKEVIARFSENSLEQAYLSYKSRWLARRWLGIQTLVSTSIFPTSILGAFNKIYSPDVQKGFKDSLICV